MADFKEVLIKNKTKEIKRKSNKYLVIFLVIFVLGYAFFFTSNLFLPPTYQGVTVTKIAEPISSYDREITVASWTYSEEQKEMEVIVEIENKSLDGKNDYEWQARDKNGLLKTRVIHQDPKFAVINISDLKHRWTEVALDMMLKGESESENGFSGVRLYTNDKEVKRVKSISKKSMGEYMLIATDSKINAVREEVKKINVKIKESVDTQEEIKILIRDLKEKEKYMTETEIEENKIAINDYEQRLNTEENSEKQLNDKIVELEKKISLLREERKGYEQGKSW